MFSIYTELVSQLPLELVKVHALQADDQGLLGLSKVETEALSEQADLLGVELGLVHAQIYTVKDRWPGPRRTEPRAQRRLRP